MSLLLEHWHTIAYVVIIGGVILVYIAHFFLGNVPWLEKILEPKQLLIILLLFSTVIAARVESSVDRLGDVISANKLLPAERIDNFDDLFRQLSIELGKASEQVHVTSLRRTPASKMIAMYPHARNWYDELRLWPSTGTNRRVYRVIGTGTDDMTQWFKDECATAQRFENVTLHAIAWSPAWPSFNAVVFDDHTTFLILSPPGGPLGETVAYKIEGQPFASFVIRGFVDQWIRLGTPCASDSTLVSAQRP